MKKNSRMSLLLRACAILVLLYVIILSLVQVDEKLKVGAQYKNVRPLYIMGVYDSLNNRVLSRSSARAYLHSKLYANKSEVAFQYEVPIGTTIIIIDSIPKIWHIPFFASRYLVHIEPDLSNGLDVVLSLNRGMEGEQDGLNPELFASSGVR